MSVCTIRVAPAGAVSDESRTFHVLVEEACECPAELLQQSKLAAKELMGLQEDVLLKYVDEEGDWCTLVEGTVEDALTFATPSGEDELLLELTAWPAEADAQLRWSCARCDEVNRAERANCNNCGVARHAESPILAAAEDSPPALPEVEAHAHKSPPAAAAAAAEASVPQPSPEVDAAATPGQQTPKAHSAVLAAVPRFESRAVAAGTESGLSQQEPELNGADASAAVQDVLAQFPTLSGARLLARINASAPGVAQLSACLGNDGGAAWPEDTRLQLVAGSAYGLHQLHIGPCPPGRCMELHLELWIAAQGPRTQSFWLLTSGDDEPFGPLLILDVI